MADYHIMAGDKYANQFDVVFHIPVPSATNEAGVNFRTAIVEWQGGASEISSRLPGIGTELTQLQAGELYEVSRMFASNPHETPAQKQAKLDAMWDNIRLELQEDLQDILSYWGFERTIP